MMRLSNRQLCFLFLSLLLLLPGVVAAQDVLDPNEAPTYGAVALASGFQPDPHIITVLSGGNVDVSGLGIGEGCRGFATTQPDVQLTWSGRTDMLRIFFVGEGDATLIVSDPTEQISCNDDFNSQNPAIEFANPASGIYDVWIGSFSAEDFVPGYLVVTEGESVPGAIQSSLLGMGAEVEDDSQALTTDGINANLEATFGTVELSPGFTPDPFSVSLLSGGANDVAAQAVGENCVGYAATAPDYSLNLTGDSTQLRIFFVGEGDTTLVIRDPSGEFICNDDSFGTRNPTIDFRNALAGQYDIWVGSFSTSDLVGGTLYITEIFSNDPTTVPEA